MPAFEKIVVITQKTALEELLERYTTRDQARFYLEHMGVPFDSYQTTHDAYLSAITTLKRSLPAGVRYQFVERGFLPNYLFGPEDLVVALGRDGLVVNIAKYLNNQPLLGLNPDPVHIDGVLLPFGVLQAGTCFQAVLAGHFETTSVTMAQASMNTGQTLYAVNDLFIGQRTHTSARYRIEHDGLGENQSSSGIIVSTGAGSTGWLRSLLAGAAGITEGCIKATRQTKQLREEYRFPWDEEALRYCVREPFTSKTSEAEMVFGKLGPGEELVITSHMPQNGVVFSDGVEADSLDFTSGAVLRITIAEKKLQLITNISR